MNRVFKVDNLTNRKFPVVITHAIQSRLYYYGPNFRYRTMYINRRIRFNQTNINSVYNNVCDQHRQTAQIGYFKRRKNIYLVLDIF